MYRIVLECNGIPASAGPEAAKDIAKEFVDHRHWHSNVTCSWDGSKLTLEANNDFDGNGLALQDEFSDCICAYVNEPFEGGIRVVSITQV